MSPFKTFPILSFVFQVPLTFKKAPKTLAAAEGFGLSTPLTLKNTTNPDQKKRSQLLPEEAASSAAKVPAILESDEDDLNDEEELLGSPNEYEDEYDVEMPHRYSKDRKDVNGFFVFLPALKIYFLNQACSNFYLLPFIQF